MAHHPSPLPPIETHCPNPACARAHLVKGKYAGMRGRCPACQSWMYVPRVPAAPPAAEPIHFGWAAALFLALGAAGLAVVAAAPLMPGHTVEASGEIAKALGTVAAEPVGQAWRPYAVGVPLALLALPLAALFTGAACGRATVFGRLFTYAAVGLSSALAFIAVVHFHDQMVSLDRLRELVEASKAAGTSGDATFQPGPYLFVSLGGAVVAAVMFLLAAFALHRRFWSRLIGSVMLGLPLAIGALWVFKKEIGLEDVGGFWETR